MLLASSIVIVPSFVTFSMASAMMSPITVSPFAEIVAIWRYSSTVRIFFDWPLMASTTAETAFSIPRLMAIGLAPAEMFRIPSR